MEKQQTMFNKSQGNQTNVEQLNKIVLFGKKKEQKKPFQTVAIDRLKL